MSMLMKKVLVTVAALAVAGGVVFAKHALLPCCGGESSAASAEACTAPVAGTPTGNHDPLLAACRFSCAAPELPEGTTIAAQPGVESGQATRCPVSGVVFVAEQDRPNVTVAGREYRACCASCATRLQDEPSRFINL